MCDLKVVSNNNAFYITGPDNAARMLKRIKPDLFGEPLQPGVFGAGPRGRTEEVISGIVP